MVDDISQLLWSDEQGLVCCIGREMIQEEASDPRGSTLSAMIAETDQYGVAAIEVNAGPDPTWFKLFMEADDTTSVVYRVQVIQKNIFEEGDIRTIPPAQRCSIIDLSGNYKLENYYELGRFLGDDVFNALEFINRALTDPGGLIGDWILSEARSLRTSARPRASFASRVCARSREARRTRRGASTPCSHNTGSGNKR